MVLTSLIEGLHDIQLRWEHRKSKPVSPDAALTPAVELNAFMEKDPSLRGGPQAILNMVSATPPQPLMATISSSKENMMGILTQTIRQEIQKVLLQASQNIYNSRSSSTDGRSVPFKSSGPNKQSANSNQNRNCRNEANQPTITTDTMKIRTKDTTNVAILQISNKTETIQTKKHVAIVTERITKPGIVKVVPTAEECDTCPASVENRDQIRTIGNKIRTTIKTSRTCGITNNTISITPHSNKIL